MNILRIAIIVALVSSVGGSILWWWNSQSILVDVASVTRGTLSETIVVEGATRALNRSTISAPISGLLLPIQHESGDAISKDTILAIIEPAPLGLMDARTRMIAQTNRDAARAELRRATANRESAEVKLKKVQAKRTAPAPASGQQRVQTPDLDIEEQSRKRELEAAEAVEERAGFELQIALARLGESLDSKTPGKDDESDDRGSQSNESPNAVENSADGDENQGKHNQERAEVLSQYEGHILNVLMSDGGIVAAGTPLLEIGDLSNLEFVFDVPTTEVSEIHVGTSVQLQNWNGASDVLGGVVSKIAPSASRRLSPLGIDEYRVPVTVSLETEQQPPNSLGDGYQIDGVFQVRQSEEAIKVPLGAIFRQEGEWFVFRVKEGRAVETKIELGTSNDYESTVVAGLTDYDLVILFPANRLVDGAKVSIR